MKKLILIFLIITTPSFAQQQTPTEQAMGAKILQEVQVGLTCNISLIGTQQEIDRLNKKIKELEEKDKK